MRSAGGGVERWLVLGRLLPPDVRERIFEPAFWDAVRSWVDDGAPRSRGPFVIRAVGTWAGCLPVAIPRLFVRNGHLTRLGRTAVWSMAVATVLVVVFVNVVRPYLGYEG